MSSDDDSDLSCSDCKLELYVKVWTKLLLNWVNKCVGVDKKVFKLSPKCLADVMLKYRDDVCHSDLDRTLVQIDEFEPFLEYKFPILRLRNLCEASDYPKKQYVMMSVLLYYCCTNSSGMIDRDICRNLTSYEQELILKFCEKISEMEVTVNNVNTAITETFEYVNEKNQIKFAHHKLMDPGTTLTEVENQTSAIKSAMNRYPITVMPSVITDSSNCGNYTETTVTDTDSQIYSSVKDVSIGENVVSTVSDGTTIYATSDRTTRRKKENDSKYTKKPKRVDTGTGKPSSTEKSLKKVEISEDDEFDDDDDEVTTDRSYTPTASPKHHRHFKKCTTSSCSEDKCRSENCTEPCKCPVGQPFWSGEPSQTFEAQTAQKSSTKFNLDYFNRKRKKALKKHKSGKTTKKTLIIIAIVILVVIVAVVCASALFLELKTAAEPKKSRVKTVLRNFRHSPITFYNEIYECRNKMCYKVSQPHTDDLFPSLSRCTLICMGPQLWPYPVGYTVFSERVVELSLKKMEYKFQSIPSESVQQHLAEAFKLFIGDLAKLERSEVSRNSSIDILVKKLHIQIDVETDPDPRLRVNTEEAYYLKIETDKDKVFIAISSASFCGVRHGLETLSQMILYDQSTSSLITLSNAIVKDAPSYRYRGLMIDTGRNYIPVKDLMRTIDAMAMVKLNTFHWRISDVTSFPLYLSFMPSLFNYGGYDRSMVYTKEDVTSIVRRARLRGIRVLIEVTAPGPVGRAWSWHPDATCPQKSENFTCSHVLCTRLHMSLSIFDILQEIYTAILEMTNVDDIFHLSNSMFSIGNCFYLIEDRQGFLPKALERLKLANNGIIPKLPIIWYSKHIHHGYDAKTWAQFGVQLDHMPEQSSETSLSTFKAIHSSKWDLSCELHKLRCNNFRTWQEMYSWKSWRNVDTFSIEGGEAILWTDMVNSGNIDSVLWPRAAAVAERLWSDIIANISVTGSVYERLDQQRWRMLLKGIDAEAIWPLWCSFNPEPCLQKIRLR